MTLLFHKSTEGSSWPEAPLILLVLLLLLLLLLLLHQEILWFTLHVPVLLNNVWLTGRRSVCVPADVTKEDEVKAMVETTVTTLGELNVGLALSFSGKKIKDILTV